jgi:hypothetical protein
MTSRFSRYKDNRYRHAMIGITIGVALGVTIPMFVPSAELEFSYSKLLTLVAVAVMSEFSALLLCFIEKDKNAALIDRLVQNLVSAKFYSRVFAESRQDDLEALRAAQRLSDKRAERRIYRRLQFYPLVLICIALIDEVRAKVALLRIR